MVAVAFDPIEPSVSRHWVPFESGAPDLQLVCVGSKRARLLYEALRRWPHRRGYVRLFRMIEALSQRDPSLKRVPFETPWGTRVTFDLGSRAFALLNGVKPIEPLELSVMARLMRSGDTFVDVGSHVGLYALAAIGAVGSAGRVFALEPDPVNAGIIRQLMSHTGVEVLELAASDRSGEVLLSRAGDLEASVEHGDGGTKVRCDRLDAILPPSKLTGGALHVKIDVERHEVSVLEGMRGWFDAGLRPIMQIEYLLDADGRTTTQRAEIDARLGELAHRDFRCFTYEPTLGTVRPHTLGDAAGSNVLNLLVLPNEALGRLRAAIDDPALR